MLNKADFDDSRGRKGSVTHNATERAVSALDEFYSAEKKKMSLIYSLTSEFLKIPQKSDVLPLWRRSPFIYPPFLFRRRLIQLIVFTGPDLKNCVMQEFIQHIIVETLLLVNTTYFLFGSQFMDESSWTNGMGAMYFLVILTNMLQLVSVVANVQFICTFVVIHDRCYAEC
jgi:hypothetical protein